MLKPSLLVFSFAIPAVLGSTAQLQADRRATSCGDPSFVQCSTPGLPQDFCCPGGTTCIAFNNASSIICCPGGNCDFIKPISCDVSQQNATAHPQAAIKTTQLDSKLAVCGDSCCPDGYACQSGQCSVVKKSSSSASSSSSPSSSTSASAAHTPSASHTSSAVSIPSAPSSSSTAALESSSPSSSNTPPTLASISPHCKPFPASAVLLGFFLGLLLGTLLACGGFFIRAARRKRFEISSPLRQGTPVRSDFQVLQHRKSEAESVSRSRPGSGSETASMEFVLAQSPVLPRRPPKPPKSSPNEDRDTMFADMMDGAGLQEHTPYMMMEGQRGRGRRQ